jgi:hypothetical protein
MMEQGNVALLAQPRAHARAPVASSRLAGARARIGPILSQACDPSRRFQWRRRSKPRLPWWCRLKSPSVPGRGTAANGRVALGQPTGRICGRRRGTCRDFRPPSIAGKPLTAKDSWKVATGASRGCQPPAQPGNGPGTFSRTRVPLGLAPFPVQDFISRSRLA